MREALGNDKLVTLTDYEAPTEYFWDTGATGGIEVGQYLDYAWSGYLDNEKNVQIVDPWHQGQQYVSTDHPRKPIAGLDPAKYGCINIPWYPQGPNTINDYFTDIFFWRQAGNKQSNILVLKVCGRFFRIISKALGLAAFRLDIRILPTMALG